MTDHQWSEIFSLNDELKRIEDEVDKRLEETLTEDPHVIETETVHYDENPGGRTDTFRMRQSLPIFGMTQNEAVPEMPGTFPQNEAQDGSETPWQNMTVPPMPEVPQQNAVGIDTQESWQQECGAGNVDENAGMECAAGSAGNEASARIPWMSGPIEDYVAPRAPASAQDWALASPESEARGREHAATETDLRSQDALADVDPATAGLQQDASAGTGSQPGDALADPGLQTTAASSGTGMRSQDASAGIQHAEADATSGEPVPDAQEPHAPEDTGERPGDPAGNAASHTGAMHQARPQDARQTGHAAGETSPRDMTVETARPDTRRDAAQRRRVLLVLLLIIVALLVVLGQWYYKEQIIPGQQYEAAEALYESGDYDGAIAAFSQIRGYRDAAERLPEAEYQKAAALAADGSYAEAVEYIDNLSDSTEQMQTLRAHAIYQIAADDYANGDLESAAGELVLIQDYEEDGRSALDLLHEIQYTQASNALENYDFATAEPILSALGDYEDAAALLQQVRDAIDIVYTDVARDDDGKEIAGQTQYLWVHSVITPHAVSAESYSEDLRELAGATDSVDDESVHVLMMHMDVTDAEMTYEDAEPVKVDNSTIVTKDVTSYAAIDDTFGSSQTIYDPQTLQRSNTDYAIGFEGSEAYAARNADSDEVRMECKMADDGYWCKTRRVYAQMDDEGRLVGVPRSQLRTWTQVLNESIADEIRAGFLKGMSN